MGKQFLEITEKKEVDAIIACVAAEVAKARAAKTDASVEEVKVDEALGRSVSADVFSALNVPPFDRAIMDGYAVVASDTFYADENNPASLIITGSISAGESPSQRIDKGYCMGISTGAPLPKGANATVKVENTSEYADNVEGKKTKKVKVYKPVAPGENIMLAGSDIKRGERIVRRGTTLTPRETGVLAACGLNEVAVHKKPIVAIISSGNELIAPGEDLEPAKIYDVNSQALSDSVRECGCSPYFLGIARDNVEDLSKRLNESLEKGVDIIIVSGGTSAGVGDLLPKVIEELGEILVHGVDIKPGKPFIFGTLQGKPFFGLPGNPTSALVTFNLFVAPLLRTISGIPEQNHEKGGRRRKEKRIKAKAAQRIFSERGRNEYVLVNLVSAKKPEEASVIAYPILTGSGAITTLAKADGYIFMEKGKEIIEEGEEVDVALLTEIPRR
ncbi:MAG TPA: gephyrin-like molybdotransferase Glp [Candidatus Bathyarchaeia archaeon]|nr:gephyrin-like molybdotransferase Glp [Candidatus Bathyarchaeia archaeon]